MGGNWLTKGQKAQLAALTTLLGIYLLVYLIHGLLNGYSYTNQFIQSNPIALFFFALIPVSLIPVYKQTDATVKKAVKQFGWNGAVLITASLTTALFFYINEPANTLQTVAYFFASIFTPVLFFQLIAMIIIAKHDRR